MMTTDSLRFIVPSAVSSSCTLSCHAGAFASHVVQPYAQPPQVQTSCLERARPVVAAVFAGALAVSSTAPPGRRRPERKRRAKAEGKIKGRGTWPLEKPVCTWGWRGTRLGAAACREGAPCRVGMGEIACFVRWTATTLDGAAP